MAGRTVSRFAAASALAAAAVLIGTSLAGAIDSGDRLYLSSSTSGSVDGVAFADEDIVVYDASSDTWSLFFDGSDVGLRSSDVDAIHVADDGDAATLDTIYLSLNRGRYIDGTYMDDSDILRFVPTSLGDTTSGSFEKYFDGSDVGLRIWWEDVDAFGFTSDGTLLISTLGSAYVPRPGGGTLVVRDEDILAFDATSLGETTAGSWSRYFDGSDVSLRSGSEDIKGLSSDAESDQLAITTLGRYRTADVRGDRDDVLMFDPESLGPRTRGTFSLFFDGDDHPRMGREGVDAVSLARVGASNPGIDIEKLTNGVDAPDQSAYPEVIPGDVVTFTYIVTNTGDVEFTAEEISMIDDHGTVADPSDDFTPEPVLSDGFNVGDFDRDNVLSPGESWTYSSDQIAELPPNGLYQNLATVAAGAATDSDASGYVVINRGPSITSPSSVDVLENQTSVVDVQAVDDFDTEGAGLTYVLTGGADQSLFSIDPVTGVVTFNTAPDYENPTDADGDNAYDVQVTVTDSGGLTAVQDLQVNVGDVDEAGSIGDLVWNDLDGDGRQDANEPGVGGVSVTLVGGGPDGVVGTADDTTATTTTDVNGLYSFAGIDSGVEYQIVVPSLPSGFLFTLPNVGGDDALDSDLDPLSGISAIVTLSPGEVNTDLDAGVVETASLGDFVWSDDDQDGVQDAGEAGFEGVMVTLSGGGADRVLGTADDTTEVTLTGADGSYVFTALVPNVEYQVTFANLTSGFTFTTPDVGNDALDSDANPTTGAAPVVILGPGSFNGTIDAGIVAPNTGPTITSPPSAAMVEGGTDAIDVQAVDDLDAEGSGLVFSLSGGADQAAFSIDANSGQVSFLVAPSFASPTDADGDNFYEVQVTVADSGGLTAVQDITIEVTGGTANTAPVITSASAVDVDENNRLTLNVNATDDLDGEANGLVYSVSGGADGALFDIDMLFGFLVSLQVVDFENPVDADGDNQYEVEVTVTDSGGLVGTQLIIFTVLDVDETGT